MRLGTLLLLSCVLALPARADTPQELYVVGKFAQAESGAVAEDTAAGFALAARSELAAESLRPEPCKPCLDRAQLLALRAIDADAQLAEGHIEYVVALGYQARLIGMIEARFKGYAEKAKAHIDAALVDDPGNAWAWAALGGWNIEITRDAGSTLARWFYGASLRAGLDDFGKAIAAAPRNPVIRYQYGLTLAAYDRNAYRAAIFDALERAVAASPASAFESDAQTSAKELLADLKSGDMGEFDRRVRHDQGYP